VCVHACVCVCVYVCVCVCVHTAGLPDMSMSALVKEQLGGISPLAISLIPPEKLAVSPPLSAARERI